MGWHNDADGNHVETWSERRGRERREAVAWIRDEIERFNVAQEAAVQLVHETPRDRKNRLARERRANHVRANAEYRAAAGLA